MTRHNLDSHISWLLSSKVAPAVGVHMRNPTAAAAAIEIVDSGSSEDEFGEEFPGVVRIPDPNRPIPHTINVVHDFMRPPVPSISSKSQLREPTNNSREESMGKLTSAQRSTRPGLMSQHQLATPASTTISTAGSSSLRQGYATFLREHNGTPSSRPTTDRLLPKLARSLQTPQTPRQTPRPTLEPKPENVESVDLTRDDSEEDPISHSSNGIEDSASRAEPPTRSSRKRKSGEISAGSPMRTEIERQPAKAKRIEHQSLDGFVDIDDMVPRRSQADRPTPEISRPQSVRPSIEDPIVEHDMEEEYPITETISKVETRTRKSISRVPSMSDATSSTPKLALPVKLPESQKKIDAPGTPTKYRPVVQVAASPIRSPNPRHDKSPSSESVSTQKRQKRRLVRTIEDSEDDDDDIFSKVEKKASCSPRTSVKNTPQVIDTSKPAKWSEIPEFESHDLKFKDAKDTKPRVGSPLRPISRNVAVRQDSLLSPFQKDSPTRLSHASKPSRQQSSQSTPTSTLGADEKKLAIYYLAQPSSISTYCQRVMNLLNQNSVASMSYMDEGEVAPKHLMEERKVLLDMKKAYAGLEDLAERYRTMMTEKKNLARKIYELLDKDGDTSVQEERQSALSQDLRRIEKEIGQLLHASGAIKDGFGTGSDSDAAVRAQAGSSKAYEGSAPLPSGSSTIGSAQIIMQTQFPSLQQKSTPSSNLLAEVPPKTSPSRKLVSNSVSCCHQESPSPVRQQVPFESFTGQDPHQVQRNGWGAAEGGIRQPNFYRDPPPMDYSFDVDDAAFDNLLQEEQELRNHSNKRDEIPYEIEEDYGASDDDDMLEFVEEVERHSLPEQRPSKHTRPVLSESSDTTPEPPMRSRAKATKNMYSHVYPEGTDLVKYPWFTDVKRALKERFKLNGFRYHQLDAINATLGGKDAFVLMPTGGGKSLCYQLPAIVQSGKTKGLTIVISPLLSLMNDQVQHLRKINIRAATLNSEVTGDVRTEIMNNLGEQHPEQFIELLYITPEMITKSTNIQNVLSRLHRNKKLARIVIDEAHCVSQWGHDFRPDYVALGQVRERYPNVPLMALTATATENVKVDVMHNLGMGKCPIFAQSFNRPNLNYEVRSKKGKGKAKEILQDIADLVKKKYKNQSGIIYTLSRKGCEQMAEKLKNEHGIKAHHYHASMRPDEKAAVQKNWQSGRIQVVVATIAFGMGIDKADVRFVIHHTIPKSLEGYYQETGRAGRDGKKSGCYLYYGYQDTAVLKDFIYESDASPEQKERQRKMLSRMVQYCENRADCRRVQVLAYFGETFAKEDCEHSCDNCSSDTVFESIDFTTQAQAAMRIVKQAQKDEVTLLHCVDILRGQSTTKIKRFGHEKLQEFGVASNMARSEVERLFFRLLMENALAEHNVINKGGFASQYINLGPNCRGFMSGSRKLKLLVQVSASPGAGAKQKQQNSPKKLETTYPSTMLTSPLSPSSRRRKPTSGPDSTRHGYSRDGFVTSENEEVEEEEDDFESMPAPRRRREDTPGDAFGAPITTDERMAILPDIHRDVIHQFVDEAKILEEKIRNGTGARKPFFTEANLREMAINWTLTLDEMRQIPDINIERVDKYWKRFVPLIERNHKLYDEMMNQNEDRDIDMNHQNVIDLCSDDEDDYGFGDEDEEAILEAEQGSKYFQNTTKTSASNNSGRKLPWAGTSNSKSTGAQKSGRGGFPFRKGRGGRKGGSRKSNGSASGQSTSAVSKRKYSGGAKKTRASKGSGTSTGSNFMRQFGHQGGGGSGGIGIMPT